MVRHWRLLATAFPEAKFLHTVRDPRAVAASLRKSAAHLSNALAAAKRWRLDTAAGLAMEAALGARVLRVSYENLATSPEATLRHVCTFLELPYEPEMLLADRKLALNTHEAMHGHHQRVGEPITADSVAAWQKELSPGEQAIVAAFTHDVAAACGYVVPPAPLPSAWARLRYGADSLAVACRKLARDLAQRRPFWRLWLRRLRLGTFFSQARDYFAGR